MTKCYNQNSAGDCGLIQRLKTLQAEKREIDDQIKAYQSNDICVVGNFIKFLEDLDKNGCFRFCGHYMSSRIQDCFIVNGTTYLEKTLSTYSASDIQTICDELKALTYRANIIQEKEELSNKLAAEIKEIKDALGIE